MKKVLGGLVLGIIFLNPLISANWGIFDNEFVKLWLIYVGVILSWLVLGICLLHRSTLVKPGKPVLILVIVYVLVHLLAGARGVSFYHSFWGRYGVWTESILTLLVLISMAYFIFILISKRIINAEQIYNAVVVSGVLVATWALWIGWTQGLILNEVRLEGVFRNPNQLGFYLVLVFSLTLWKSFLAKTGKQRLLLTGGWLLMGAVLIFTQSRGSWLATASANLLAIVFFRKKIKGQIKRSGIKLMLGVFVLFLILGLPKMVTRFKIETDSPRVSHQIRLEEWRRALNIWKSHPWTGIGGENFKEVYPQFKERQDNLISEEWAWRISRVRNRWLALLVGLGPLGLGMFLLLGAVVAYKMQLNRETIPALIGLLAYYLHAFVYTLNVSAEVLFFVFLGVLVAAKPARKAWGIKPVVGVALIGGSLFLLILLARILMGEVYVNKSKAFNNSLSIAYRTATTAYRFNPYFTSNLHRMLLSQERMIRNNQVEGDRAEEIEIFYDNIVKLENHKSGPLSLEDKELLAAMYMRYAGFTNTSYEKAIKLGEEVVRLAPTSPTAWDSLGIIYLDSKQYQRALNIFNFILNGLKPDYPFAYFHIGETYRQKGEPEKSIPYYEKALELGYDGAVKEIEEAKEEVNNIAY